MVYDEIWSYTHDQIEQYLYSNGAVYDGAFYCLDECTVALEALPSRRLGHFDFPQTRIMVDGPGADRFYHGFRLQFLTGGG